MQVDWVQLKSFVDDRSLSIQYVDLVTKYWLIAFDSSFSLETILMKDTHIDEIAEFEANYKPVGNGTIRQDFRPMTPKNDHTMVPCGAVKGSFTASDCACEVTLSDPSEDGYTFTYAMSKTPRVGDYVFQDNFTKRAWITSIDLENSKITFDSETIRAPMAAGTAHYSQGQYVSFVVPTWLQTMFLWGISSRILHTNGHDSRNDFIELSIVDSNDLFLSDDFCQAVFGCNAATAAETAIPAMGFETNGEYGHWTKYYDESWSININNKLLNTPDGAPGELLSLLETRISYFTSKTDNTLTEVFLDYYFTGRI